MAPFLRPEAPTQAFILHIARGSPPMSARGTSDIATSGSIAIAKPLTAPSPIFKDWTDPHTSGLGDCRDPAPRRRRGPFSLPETRQRAGDLCRFRGRKAAPHQPIEVRTRPALDVHRLNATQRQEFRQKRSRVVFLRPNPHMVGEGLSHSPAYRVSCEAIDLLHISLDLQCSKRQPSEQVDVGHRQADKQATALAQHPTHHAVGERQRRRSRRPALSRQFQELCCHFPYTPSTLAGRSREYDRSAQVPGQRPRDDR